MSVLTILAVSSFYFSFISSSFICLFINESLQQLQIVRSSDLQVSLKVHPILFIIVWNTSEHPLIKFLQSYYLGVIPIVERRRRVQMCFLVRSGCFVMNLSSKYELNEWQTKVEFLGLKWLRSTRIVDKKQSSISSMLFSEYSCTFLLKPIPLISQKITLPLFRRGETIVKFMRLLPPNPCPTKKSFELFFSNLDLTTTAWMVYKLLTGMSIDWQERFMQLKSSYYIQWTSLRSQGRLVSSTLEYITKKYKQGSIQYYYLIKTGRTFRHFSKSCLVGLLGIELSNVDGLQVSL